MAKLQIIVIKFKDNLIEQLFVARHEVDIFLLQSYSFFLNKFAVWIRNDEMTIEDLQVKLILVVEDRQVTYNKINNTDITEMAIFKWTCA